MNIRNLELRDDTVTMTKGIGILLMVIGHSGCPMYITKFIYMFHMPLFFLMSGYCFKEKYLSDCKSFIWRRIKGLYWPFIKWGTLFIILHNALCYIYINPTESVRGEHIYNGIGSNVLKLVTHITCLEPLLGGYWFLRELFLGSIIAYVTLRIMRGFRMYAWVLLLVISLIMREWDFTLFPKHIALSFLSIYSAAFVAFGYSVKNFIQKPSPTWSKVLLLFTITIVSSIVYPNYEVFNQTPYSMFPYLITSTCGTFMVYYLCKLIHWHHIISDFLISCGNHSLVILTWHFLSFKLVSLMIIVIYGYPIEQLSCIPILYMPDSIWWIAYFGVGFMLPLVSIQAWEYAKFRIKRPYSHLKANNR